MCIILLKICQLPVPDLAIQDNGGWVVCAAEWGVWENCTDSKMYGVLQYCNISKLQRQAKLITN